MAHARAVAFDDEQYQSQLARRPYDLRLNRPCLVESLIPRKGGLIPAPMKYPTELHERAQRMVAEAMVEDPTL